MIYLTRVFGLACKLFKLIWKIFLIFGVTPIVMVAQIMEPLICYPFYYIKTGRTYWDYYYCIMEVWMGYVLFDEDFTFRKEYMFQEHDRIW
jgi:hypothetical protein